jgi:hypothetical protein
MYASSLRSRRWLSLRSNLDFSLRSKENRHTASLRSLFAPLEHSTISWRSAGIAIRAAHPLEATLRLLGVGGQGFRSETFGYGKPHDKIKENAPRKGVLLYRFVGVFGFTRDDNFGEVGYGLTKTLGGDIRAAGLLAAWAPCGVGSLRRGLPVAGSGGR